ncbi:hypothetical protein HHI36_023650 [Cryptolaemus montrouzieri]|uniref:Uncharacterized protein n=1 Tax=Cryptolaemus montrouzieri TaxID=559131 RepID=A0ABD2PIB4_9CUCU
MSWDRIPKANGRKTLTEIRPGGRNKMQWKEPFQKANMESRKEKVFTMQGRDTPVPVGCRDSAGPIRLLTYACTTSPSVRYVLLVRQEPEVIKRAENAAHAVLAEALESLHHHIKELGDRVKKNPNTQRDIKKAVGRLAGQVKQLKMPIIISD